MFELSRSIGPAAQLLAGMFRLGVPKRVLSSFDYRIVEPGSVSAIRTVPGHIEKPTYASTIFVNSTDLTKNGNIEIKSTQQIERMKDSCKLAREILMDASTIVKEGVTTDEIDEFVHNLTIQRGAYPSPLLYMGFPKSVCTSVNNVACHGIPDDQRLRQGDIINIDVTIFYRGFHGDTSETFIVGETDAEGEVLIETAMSCRNAGINICGPGVPFTAIGSAISEEANVLDYEVIPDFCGHGIGETFHAAPGCIIQCINDMDLGVMKEGMTFTVEPILSEGSPKIKILKDGWTAVSTDGSRSAQCEHTILVTEHGAEVLTRL